MGKGLGRALQSALVQDGPGEDLGVEGSGLANARRRAVFALLCLKPCSRVGVIGRRLAMSQATVRWHEGQLTSKGYLEMHGTRAFPRGLIDPADADLFALLATPGRSEVLSACFSDPGVSLLELASRVGLTRQSLSKIGGELHDASLVTFVEDGRFRRYYPTDLLHRKREANLPRTRAFVDSVLRHLGDEGLGPEILQDAGSILLLRLGAGGKRVVLDLRLDPYATAWRAAA
jgi:DNA-binding transcriptional ArsR family regulator